MDIVGTLGNAVTSWLSTCATAIGTTFEKLFTNGEGALSVLGTSILTFGGIALAGSLIYVVLRLFKK